MTDVIRAGRREIKLQPKRGRKTGVSGNCSKGLHNNCFNLGCECDCHKPLGGRK